MHETTDWQAVLSKIVLMCKAKDQVAIAWDSPMTARERFAYDDRRLRIFRGAIYANDLYQTFGAAALECWRREHGAFPQRDPILEFQECKHMPEFWRAYRSGYPDAARLPG